MLHWQNVVKISRYAFLPLVCNCSLLSIDDIADALGNMAVTAAASSIAINGF